MAIISQSCKLRQFSSIDNNRIKLYFIPSYSGISAQWMILDYSDSTFITSGKYRNYEAGTFIKRNDTTLMLSPDVLLRCTENKITENYNQLEVYKDLKSYKVVVSDSEAYECLTFYSDSLDSIMDLYLGPTYQYYYNIKLK